MLKVSVWIALAVGVLMLVACGETGGDSSNTGDSSATASSQPPAQTPESTSSDSAVEEAPAEPENAQEQASIGAAEPTSAPSSTALTLDPDLPAYQPRNGVAGSLRSIGSDTMNNIMAYWATSFGEFYPSVKVEVEGKGSSTAPPALTQGQAQFGPMSRAMKQAELQGFEDVHGYKPAQLRTGIDCLAVFVHKDNPLESISLENIRRVFSVDGPEMTWGDLGVTDPEYAGRRIDLYGRNSASGTYGYFKKLGLGGSDFKATVKEQPGSSAVVQAIGRDKLAMGYSGVGYTTQDVRALPVTVEGGPGVTPSAATAYDGTYPLARFLYVYVAADPRAEFDPLRGEFIRMMFSREGQEAVLKDGYYPVSARLARQELEKLGLAE